MLMKHRIFPTVDIDRPIPCEVKHSPSQPLPNVALSSIPIFCTLTSQSLQLSLCLNSSSLSLAPLPPFLPSSLPLSLSHTFQCLPGDAYHWRAQHLFLHPIDPVIETSLICSLLPVLYLPPVFSLVLFPSFALSRQSHLNSLTITHNPSLQFVSPFQSKWKMLQ